MSENENLRIYLSGSEKEEEDLKKSLGTSSQRRTDAEGKRSITRGCKGEKLSR